MSDWDYPQYPADFRSSYMGGGQYNPAELIARAREQFEQQGVECDTLVGTGLSGALVVPQMARELGKEWLIVRKPNEGTHSSRPVEGYLGRRWLFVDDGIQSGKTFRRVFDTIAELPETASYYWRMLGCTEFAGAYFYTSATYGDYWEEPVPADVMIEKYAKRKPFDWGEAADLSAPLPPIPLSNWAAAVNGYTFATTRLKETA
ncbi:MAG: phosphoribosyltransferase [Mycobacterium sp.]